MGNRGNERPQMGLSTALAWADFGAKKESVGTARPKPAGEFS